MERTLLDMLCDANVFAALPCFALKRKQNYLFPTLKQRDASQFRQQQDD